MTRLNRISINTGYKIRKRHTKANSGVVRYAVVCFLFLYVHTAVAQTISRDSVAAPDYDRIHLEITDESSPYFYPKLFSRYLEGDTTLNLQDYRHLYYGYSFNTNYHPLKTRSYSDSLATVLEKNNDSTRLSPTLLDEVQRISKQALLNEPFSMNFINFLTYIYQVTGDYETAKKYSYKLKMIKGAIMSSGTGISDRSPWHVLYRNDMQDILASLKARPSKRMYITSEIEYFHLPVKNNEQRGYYFNTGRIFSVPLEDETGGREPKRKFEFNPYQNPRSSRYIKDIRY